MSQYDWADIDPDEEDGTELAARLNAWVAAVLSSHRGSAAPSYAEAGLEWQKTVSSTVEQRYVYDGAQDLLLYTINPTAHTVQVPAANLPASTTSAQGAVELLTNAEQLAGTDATRAATADSVAALWEKGTDNTGGATITLGDGGSFNLITSTTAITAFVFTNDKAGRRARIRFNTVRTLTHNSTSLILPDAANKTTAAGDICEIESLGSGNFRVNWYTPATTPTPAPAASASVHKNNTDQTGIATGTQTKVTFGSEAWDTGSLWDASNSKSQPNRACKLRLSGVLYVSAGMVDGGAAFASVYLNGALYKSGPRMVAGAASPVGAPFDIIVDLNGSTDYAEIYFFANGAGNKTIDGGPSVSYLQIEEVK